MGMKSSIKTVLPTEVILELKTRLRSDKFTQMEITEWLNGLGYCISKSAVNRYSTNLQEHDAKLIIDKEHLIKSKNINLVFLLEELEILRQRETEIIAIISTQLLTGRKKTNLKKRLEKVNKVA